jgi:hypothetical protein
MKNLKNTVPCVKKSSVQNPSCRTKSAKAEPYQVQVVHQIIISEGADCLVGQKVVYNEKYYKVFGKPNNNWREEIPECGYFVITKAVLQDDGRVMVALDAFTEKCRAKNIDGTHMRVGYFKKFQN